MLRKNLNVSRGLVNGSIGIFKHFLYETGKKTSNLPFENVDVSDLNIKYIPICPVQSQLVLAYCQLCLMLVILNFILDSYMLHYVVLLTFNRYVSLHHCLYKD
ncbi:hypothetical protein FOCC_FOCC013418 [Frankliniella occidentalis]|nr:hypothetical protein FOCC_FOCC013418 [Frankliniella occidentalis]